METTLPHPNTTARRASADLVGAAVNRSRLLSAEGVIERLFTLAFSGLVYPQIWEDPAVDLAALELHSSCRMVTIASGGCNLLSYVTAGPEHITAVDLNAAHVALNRMKIVAAEQLDHDAFFSMFGNAATWSNVALFDQHIASHLDNASLSYWTSRDSLGRRRIEVFARNLYRTGLLGRFITAAHLLARAHGVDPSRILLARNVEKQRAFFEKELAPLLRRRSVRWIIGRPASLFGLGIPPAQYKSLAGDHADGIAAVLHHRLQRLACDFPLADNYFARQAFGRSYGGLGSGTLPPYLERKNFDALKSNVDRIAVRHVSITNHLKGSPDRSLDRYVLLDAQDWMNDTDLTALWREITRTARPGARVIFRTAAEPSLLPGRVPGTILGQWTYHDEASKRFTAQDRSAIYGGFHLYLKAD